MHFAERRVPIRRVQGARSKRKHAPSRPLLAKYRQSRDVSAWPNDGEPTASNRRLPTRRVALTILVVVPIAVAAWAMSILVPTAYQAWQANGDIFQPRASREGFANQAPPAPSAMPPAVSALLTATVQGTPAGSLETPIPVGTLPDAPPTPTIGTITHPDLRPTVPGGVDGDPEQDPAEPSATPLPDWNGTDPVHILLLGVDTRPSEEIEGRSDTMIVVRVDPEIGRVDMFSIPRDLAVDIPGFADGVKINSAFPWGELYDVPGGGPSLVAQTIEFNFGISIDYFATVDIPGLERVVDTLGGVLIDVDAQLKDDQYPTEDFGYTRAYFPAGIQRMNGREAVQFARTRHADGDFRRAERQQQLLLGLRDQIIQTGLITRLPDLLSDLRNTVRTDLTARQVLSLGSLAQNIDRSNIWIHSLAPYTFASVTDQGWFLLGDWDALRWITQNLDQDPLATNAPGG